ncbi:MAG: chloride channel protein [Gallionellaceae bacterium]|nr:chloride channel protein [Gallionellaceae bacterium]
MSSDKPDPSIRLRDRLAARLYRLKRRQVAYRHVWIGRLIFWGGAVAIGLVAVLFAQMTELAVETLHGLDDRFPGWVFLSAPLGGALIVWLTRRYCMGAEGSGIPQVMAEMAQHGHRHRLIRPLLTLRIMIGKIVLGIGAIFAGFSAGREGPMVQIGAALMHLIGERLPRRLQVDRRHLLAAGGAAGIAAAFNTPLAGILFAIEELSRGVEERMSGLIITAIVIAGVVAQVYFGNYTYFGWLDISKVDTPHPVGLLLMVSLTCGLAGGAFARLMILSATGLPGRLGRWRRDYPIRFAAGCGLAVALIGLVSDGLTYGTGYGEAKHLLAQDTVLPWHYGIDKFFATLVTFASGVPGGIFAPSLSIGAGLGQNLHLLAGQNYLPAMTNVLCMASFLAAVTQTPITAFVIVMEMVSGYGLVIDLMIVTLLASGVSRTICPPLYRTLALRYLAAPERAAPEPVAAETLQAEIDFNKEKP